MTAIKLFRAPTPGFSYRNSDACFQSQSLRSPNGSLLFARAANSDTRSSSLEDDAMSFSTAAKTSASSLS